ncbi:VanZ family protein [Streptomyces albidoflavus]
MPLWTVIYAVTPWSVAGFVLALVALVAGFEVWGRRDRRTARRVARVGWWGLSVLVLAVTVVPTEPLWSQAGSVQFVPGAGVLSLSGEGMYEPQRQAVRLTLVANALMFAPLPVLQTAGGRRNLRPWALVGQYAALSALIELAQLAALAGRSADVDDVLCNTAGAALGVGCALAGRWVAGRWKPRTRAGNRVRGLVRGGR